MFVTTMKLTHSRSIYRGLIAFAAAASLQLGSAADVQAQADAPLGIYGGAGCDGVKQFNSFSTWLGRRPQRALDFLSWSSLVQNSGWSMACWSAAGVKDLTYSVPMLPEDGSATLAQGAAGQFDHLFTTLAKTLVSRGYAHAVIRIGWEFNGDWYSWAASKDPQAWIAYWRRIVGVMRSVPGTHFKFDWCPGMGWTPTLAQDVYPGDDVVDIIGLDAYNQSWNPNATTPELRWDDQVNGRHGLKWHADFAAAHGKPISFPEWGTGTRQDGKGGGDDALYIEQMAEWIATHNVAYHNYWDYSHPLFDGKISNGSQPKSGAAFLKKFRLPRPKSPHLHQMH